MIQIDVHNNRHTIRQIVLPKKMYIYTLAKKNKHSLHNINIRTNFKKTDRQTNKQMYERTQKQTCL